MNGRGLAPAVPTSWADVLVASATQLPQASSVVEVDVSRVAQRIAERRDAWQQRGLEPTFTPFLAAALLLAIRNLPQVNAAL